MRTRFFFIYRRESSDHHPKPLFEHIIFCRTRPTDSPNYGSPTSFVRKTLAANQKKKKKKLFLSPDGKPYKDESSFFVYE